MGSLKILSKSNSGGIKKKKCAIRKKRKSKIVKSIDLSVHSDESDVGNRCIANSQSGAILLKCNGDSDDDDNDDGNFTPLKGEQERDTNDVENQNYSSQEIHSQQRNFSSVKRLFSQTMSLKDAPVIDSSDNLDTHSSDSSVSDFFDEDSTKCSVKKRRISSESSSKLLSNSSTVTTINDRNTKELRKHSDGKEDNIWKEMSQIDFRKSPKFKKSIQKLRKKQSKYFIEGKSSESEDLLNNNESDDLGNYSSDTSSVTDSKKVDKDNLLKRIQKDEQSEKGLNYNMKQKKRNESNSSTFVIKKRRHRTNESALNKSVFTECLICNCDLSNLNIEERETHINGCLDKQNEQTANLTSDREAIERCLVCKMDISYFSERRKMKHINTCLDRQNNEERSDTAKKHSKKKMKEVKKDSSEDDEDQSYVCFICYKNLSSINVKNRIKHLKLCAKLNNISAEQVKKLLKAQKDFENVKKKKKKKRKNSKREKPEKKSKDDIALKKKNLNNAKIKTDETYEHFNESEPNRFEVFEYDKGLVGHSKDLFEVNEEVKFKRENTIQDVQQWLESMNLKEYFEKFIENGFDTLDVCCDITMEDLKDELKIKKTGHRKRLLQSAKQLKKKLILIRREEEKKKKMNEQNKEVKNKIETEPKFGFYPANSVVHHNYDFEDGFLDNNVFENDSKSSHVSEQEGRNKTNTIVHISSNGGDNRLNLENLNYITPTQVQKQLTVHLSVFRTEKQEQKDGLNFEDQNKNQKCTRTPLFQESKFKCLKESKGKRNILWKLAQLKDSNTIPQSVLFMKKDDIEKSVYSGIEKVSIPRIYSPINERKLEDTINIDDYQKKEEEISYKSANTPKIDLDEMGKDFQSFSEAVNQELEKFKKRIYSEIDNLKKTIIRKQSTGSIEYKEYMDCLEKKFDFLKNESFRVENLNQIRVSSPTLFESKTDESDQDEEKNILEYSSTEEDSTNQIQSQLQQSMSPRTENTKCFIEDSQSFQKNSQEKGKRSLERNEEIISKEEEERVLCMSQSFKTPTDMSFKPKKRKKLKSITNQALKEDELLNGNILHASEFDDDSFEMFSDEDLLREGVLAEDTTSNFKPSQPSTSISIQELNKDKEESKKDYIQPPKEYKKAEHRTEEEKNREDIKGWSLEKITQEIEKYGIKRGSKTFMVEKLKEILTNKNS